MRDINKEITIEINTSLEDSDIATAAPALTLNLFGRKTEIANHPSPIRFPNRTICIYKQFFLIFPDCDGVVFEANSYLLASTGQ